MYVCVVRTRVSTTVITVVLVRITVDQVRACVLYVLNAKPLDATFIKRRAHVRTQCTSNKGRNKGNKEHKTARKGEKFDKDGYWRQTPCFRAAVCIAVLVPKSHTRIHTTSTTNDN